MRQAKRSVVFTGNNNGQLAIGNRDVQQNLSTRPNQVGRPMPRAGQIRQAGRGKGGRVLAYTAVEGDAVLLLFFLVAMINLFA
jgi:hypothetical protein